MCVRLVHERIRVKISFYIVCFLQVIFVRGLQAEVNANTLAILINESDPESIEIGQYYQKARSIPYENIIYLSFRKSEKAITQAEFMQIEEQLKGKVSDKIQAYALAWRKPWRVACMSITSAFSLGFNPQYCASGCKLTRSSRYFSSQSQQPFNDFAIRPSMLLSAGSVDGVKKLIDRSVLADYTRPMGTAYLVSTRDKNRNVRARYFPAYESSLNKLLNVEQVSADAIQHKKDVMFYFTGRAKVKHLRTNTFLPGSVADHLTSAGGHLFNGKQMSVLEWIDSGASGSYGTVTEPCNFLQKFPVPGIVMQRYLSGETLLESYWKGVQMPGQGLFVGDPLVSPYKGCTVSVSQTGVFQYVRKTPENLIEQKFRNCH
ncbi:hypothetical protein MNBD_GAMMA09-3289 [hydrothermal vent metagenome]|uniref:TIGR03790 family protein n=1 Tax=hydrothermal vent metagenome TaxID=652676 RepID=A0A3B0XRG5_9ZZZZ